MRNREDGDEDQVERRRVESGGIGSHARLLSSGVGWD